LLANLSTASFSAVVKASAALTFTSGSTPVPSQSPFVTGLMGRAKGTPMVKSSPAGMPRTGGAPPPWLHQQWWPILSLQVERELFASGRCSVRRRAPWRSILHQVGTPKPRRSSTSQAGSGVRGIAAAQAFASATLTAVNFPEVLEVTRSVVSRFGLNGRFHGIAGDVLRVNLGSGYIRFRLLVTFCTPKVKSAVVPSCTKCMKLSHLAARLPLRNLC